MNEGVRPAEKDSTFVARRKLAFVAAAFLGALFAIGAVVLILAARGRQQLPITTPEHLHDAIQRWQQCAIEDYDVEVKLQALQTESHLVQVRNGQVEQYLRNGRPMTLRRTFETWSVPGMFSTIQQDLDHIDLVASGKAGPNTPYLRVGALFHPRYGYPEWYFRVQRGANVEVSWEVVRFHVVDE